MHTVTADNILHTYMGVSWTSLLIESTDDKSTPHPLVIKVQEVCVLSLEWFHSIKIIKVCLL